MTRSPAGAVRDALTTIVLVTTLAVLVITGATQSWDQAGVDAATDVARGRDLLDALTLLEEITRPVWLYVFATIVCIVVGWRAGIPWRAFAAWASMMLIWGGAALLKQIVDRERPTAATPVWEHDGLSFPSGHATNITAMTLGLSLLLWPLIGRLERWLLGIMTTVLIVIVALDRVFLGVHYPTDVLVGVILGGGLIAAASQLWPSPRVEV